MYKIKTTLLDRALLMMKRFFLLVCLITTGTVSYADAQSCQNRLCIAVVDAGSTGSRLHIYAYDVDSQNTPVKIHEVYSKKIKPGLATLDPKADVIRNYVSELFTNTPESNMPVYFYATAGMRLLSQPKQKLYYDAIKDWFAKQSQWQLAAAKTITGQVEAVDAWFAINYQLGRINGNQVDNGYVGVMDTGGASVQIVTAVMDSHQIDDNDTTNVVINGKSVNLYAASFLGLGQTLVTEQFLDEENCYPNGYILPNGKMAKGELKACSREIVKLINGVHAVNSTTQKVISNNAPNEWYVMGGLAAMVQSQPFNFPNQFTNQLMAEKGNDEACHRSWQDLSNENPGNDFLFGSCLFPAYYYALLVDGYGIKPEQVINFVPNNAQGADWSLGVVFNH